MEMTNVLAIKKYFGLDGDAVKEIAKLNHDEREELGAFCRAELQADGTPIADKAVALS